jgi:hypothetical protein
MTRLANICQIRFVYCQPLIECLAEAMPLKKRNRWRGGRWRSIRRGIGWRGSG